MAESPLTPVALRQHRDRTIAVLCDHFARDHLEADELERLIDQAHHATSVVELDQLLTGLPSLSEAPARPAAEFGPPVPLRTGDRDTQMVVAVMGGAERRGSWVPARRTTVVAFMGGVVLDFREAVLDPGVTEVYVLAIMGGVEILVPPGVYVDSEGMGIMGGFGQSGSAKFPVDGNGPVLRVSGVAIMGGVEIKQRAGGALPPGRRELKKSRRRDDDFLDADLD